MARQGERRRKSNCRKREGEGVCMEIDREIEIV